jgi:hypothetical protein
VSPDKTSPLASRLTRLTIVPRSKRIVGGQRFTLKLTGLLADGSAAPRTVLAGVRWATDKPRVVTVSRRGVITGHAAGNATVTASAGSVRATIAISVLAVQPPGGPGAPTTGPPVSHPTRSPGSSPQPTQTTTQLPAEPDTGHRHPSSQGARVSVGGAAGSASRAPRTLGLSAFADGNGLPEQIAVMGRPRITRMAVAPVPWPCSGRASVEPDRWHVVMPQSRRGPADCPNASDIREG